ncbi:MAG: polysaccharide biosynthesis tyrosine autokinase [Actinobacteria bacterium]|nr:polysaccharide biosynthesis tyrosine autokinase [Actinomycetota bacterium]HRY10476.1 polysaccharide biosynthesis tyrosine autokinase [Candidatus Nanopelagicales bacterium]
MTLHDYLAILRRSWAWVLAATLVGGLLALGASLLMTPIYQSQAQMFVSVKSAGQVNDAYSGGLFVQQRVKSYVDVVDSPAVLDPVIEDLGLDTTNVELAEQVSAQTPPNTVLLNVTVTDPSSKQATDIANAVAASYAAEIKRLEGASPQTGKKAGATPQVPVEVSIIKPARPALSPVSPRTALNVVLGALLGFLVGVGVAVLRHTLDTSVKTSEDLEEAAGSTGLAVVAFDAEAKKSPLVTLRGTPRAEAFRSLRTNLRYVDVDNPPHTVVITSSVLGEGKTTTACNLAIALAQAGSKVLLLEGDLRRPKVAEYLGVDGAVGITDILIGQAKLDDSIVPWQRGLLDFLPSGAIPPNPSELLGSQQMADLLHEVRGRYDAVIVDAPPLLVVTDAAVLAAAADGAILIARYGETNREQVAHAAESLEQVNARVLGTVLNFAPLRRRKGYGYGYGYGYETPKSGTTSDSGRRVLDEKDMPSPAPRN